MNIEQIREFAKQFRQLFPATKPRRRKRRGPTTLYCPKVTGFRSCGWCGERFETGRLTGSNAAKFCHPGCKRMNRRWRKTHPGFSTRQEYLEKNKND
jgi:hypothetical protein